MRLKIIKAFLGLMALSIFTFFGYAEDINKIPSGWFQTTFSNIDLSRGYFTVTDSDAYSGKTSLKLNNEDFTNNDNKSVFLRNRFSKSSEAGKYTFEFYIKTDKTPYVIAEFDGTGKKINFEGWNINPQAYGFSKTAVENGWTRVEAEFETDAPMTQFYFRLFGIADGILIDNVSLFREGSGQNLIENGEFELEAAEISGAYTPENVITYVNGKESIIGISWINPSLVSLKSVEIYDVSGGDELSVSENVKCAAGETNSVEVPLKAGETEYAFKIICGFADRESTSYYISGNTADNKPKLGAWTAYGSLGNELTLPVCAEINGEFFVSGKSSLKITSNIDGEKPYHYMDLRAPIKLTPNKTYKIRAYVKADNVKKVALCVDWNRVIAFSNASFDWKMVEAEFNNTSYEDTYMRIIADNGIGGFWIDKIEVFEMENGSASGQNLFLYGDFEDYANSDITPVAASAKSLSGGAELLWLKTAQNEDAEKILVCRYEGEKLFLIGRLYKNNDRLLITGLENGKAYEFGVCTVNAAGKISDISKVAVSPQSKKNITPYENGENKQDFIIKNKNFFNLSENLTVDEPFITKMQSGKILCGVYVKNLSESPREVCLLNIVYKNGALFKVSRLRKSIETQTAGSIGEKLSITAEIPNDTENTYTIKTMLWDNPIKMTPLDEPANLR